MINNRFGKLQRRELARAGNSSRWNDKSFEARIFSTLWVSSESLNEMKGNNFFKNGLKWQQSCSEISQFFPLLTLSNQKVCWSLVAFSTISSSNVLSLSSLPVDLKVMEIPANQFIVKPKTLFSLAIRKPNSWAFLLHSFPLKCSDQYLKIKRISEKKSYRNIKTHLHTFIALLKIHAVINIIL